MILLQTVLVSPETHLVKNLESLSTNESQSKKQGVINVTVYWNENIVFLLLVCMSRDGGHVGGHARTKHFSPLGTKLFGGKFYRIEPNMAALSHGCKPRIYLKHKNDF